MVTGAGRNHPARTFVGAQAEQMEHRAARLEAARVLQELELEQELRTIPEPLGQLFRGPSPNRRAAHPSPERLACGAKAPGRDLLDVRIALD